MFIFCTFDFVVIVELNRTSGFVVVIVELNRTFDFVEGTSLWKWDLIVPLTSSKVLRYGNAGINKKSDDKVCDLLYIFIL